MEKDNIQTTPIIFTDKKSLKKYSDKALKYVDAFENQLKELFFIKNTSFIGVSDEKVFTSKEFRAFQDSNRENFVYVYYPWNAHLIKTVPKRDYLTLKTNRNQDLITEREQKVLENFSVAVLGLSVGSNVALTLTQSGISNSITLADFDELDTTNLNRIIGGVHQVGTPKIEVSSQKIYEDNPFAIITKLREGVTSKNLRPLLEKQQIQCLIDEIDDIGFKIKLRLLAHKYKIPVLMITDNGDGIVLHIERYDLGHAKIFGKDLSCWKEKNLNNLTKKEAGKIIIDDIVGGPQNVDPKMLKSVERVMKKELVSWSQLGSAAILGSVVATIFLKKRKSVV